MKDIVYILVSIIPCILLVSLILYIIVIKKMSNPHIITTDKPLKLVGVSIKSSDANIVKDDALLWKEFKRICVKNNLPEPHTTMVVRLHTKKGEELYEYFIGMLGDSNNVPDGFKFLEIPAQRYVTSTHRFQKVVSWLKLATKVKFYIYYKWLPNSKYELNRDQAVKAIEVYHVSKNSRNRSPQIFVAVKKAVDQE